MTSSRSSTLRTRIVGVFGSAVDDLDVAGDHESRHRRDEELDELPRVDLLVGRGDDNDLDLVLTVLGRHGDGCALGDARVSG